MHLTKRPSVLCMFLVFVVSCILVSPGNCYTTVSPPQKSCKDSGTTCEKCLENVSCLWCQTNVNFEALIIAMAVVGGTILLSIIVCCCCCCCRKRPAGPDRDEERFARRREEMRQRSEDRKQERRARHDDIRKKYGLIPDSDHPYSKFENE
ncbi:hypothetical protein COCON_G00008860 [Conger conger]|uniref:Pituitary tumor-transforming gene 1 protein-interacting protein n=1 Tax=Conger conger TaxID=82655 RepID=A0A9Q1E258_CONCO|nr:hypothetical protein COCON_G00008860 [Conger conger]